MPKSKLKITRQREPMRRSMAWRTRRNDQP
jgi:hypothetical protein